MKDDRKTLDLGAALRECGVDEVGISSMLTGTWQARLRLKAARANAAARAAYLDDEG